MFIKIAQQPNDYTCGPTCLQAIYKYSGVNMSIDAISDSLEDFSENGTSDVYLAINLQRLGFHTVIHTCNIKIFDPKWENLEKFDLLEKLIKMKDAKVPANIKKLLKSYIEYINIGGQIDIIDNVRLSLKQALSRNRPIICGVNSTYLYREHRENPNTGDYDQYSDDTIGHFLIASSTEKPTTVDIADPYGAKTKFESNNYKISLTKLSESILLGTLTNEGSFITI